MNFTNKEVEPRAAHPMTRVAIAYGLAMVIGLILLSKLREPVSYYGVTTGLGFFLGKEPLLSLTWGAAGGVALALTSELASRYTRWGRAIERMLLTLVGRMHPLDALLLALLSASGEELLFRGVLLPYVGLLPSAILFGALHIVPRKHLWVWSIWAALAGLLLGYLAIATKGLVAPITAHFVVNFIGLLYAGRRRR